MEDLWNRLKLQENMFLNESKESQREMKRLLEEYESIFVTEDNAMGDMKLTTFNIKIRP